MDTTKNGHMPAEKVIELAQHPRNGHRAPSKADIESAQKELAARPPQPSIQLQPHPLQNMETHTYSADEVGIGVESGRVALHFTSTLPRSRKSRGLPASSRSYTSAASKAAPGLSSGTRRRCTFTQPGFPAYAATQKNTGALSREIAARSHPGRPAHQKARLCIARLAQITSSEARLRSSAVSLIGSLLG
jgi:hypothetical protein